MALRLSGLRAQTRVIAPCSLRPQGKPSVLFLLLRASVWNALAKRPLPRPPASQAGKPARRSKVNGTRAVAQLKRARSPELNRGLGSSLSPAFRTRMDLSACWMSQGLELVPPRPVRADCRPDIHSCRPLPSPASATSALKDRLRPLKTSAARRHCGPPRPVPRREDDRCALRIGTGRP